MTLIKLKPTSPGLRAVIRNKNDELHRDRPYSKLTEKKFRSAGRNNTGRITTRHKGGGHKQRYRYIDFIRKKDDIEAKVERLEYDPNRSANIALLCYRDGERRYIIAPKGIVKGDKVMSGLQVSINIGNCTTLANIPLGSTVHCIEMKPGKGAQIARSAGCSAQMLAKEGDYAQIRLRSGEIRRIHLNCRATIGEVGNGEHNLESIGKAGVQRWKGIRPTVRGVAMNPIDHPHGGGEGKTAAGRHPVSPWGVPAKGYRTRKNKLTNSMIIRRRFAKKG